MWPSEGSVSNEVAGIAAQLGVQWMASDEGVLDAALATRCAAMAMAILTRPAPRSCTAFYRLDCDGRAMNMVFRDHRISDLPAFVYAGMGASEAASHLLNSIKRAAAPVLESGRDAVFSIILDGENAWESYENNGVTS